MLRWRLAWLTPFLVRSLALCLGDLGGGPFASARAVRLSFRIEAFRVRHDRADYALAEVVLDRGPISADGIHNGRRAVP